MGATLDAVADKLFTLSILVTLVVTGTIGWWQAVVVLPRDLVVAALAVYAVIIRRFDAFGHMPARVTGKVATGVVLIWFVIVFVPGPAWATDALFVGAAGASVAAGLDYAVVFARRPAALRGRRPAHVT